MGSILRQRTTKARGNLPVLLSQAAVKWFQARPRLVLKAIYGVMRAGNTVQMHAWYHRVLFREPKELASTEQPWLTIAVTE
jgi:hypothetical protein